MSTYRLLAADGNVVDVFDALNDQAALTCGQAIAKEFARPAAWLIEHPEIRVERREPGTVWRLVAAWEPWKS